MESGQEQMHVDPLATFADWFAAVRDAGVPEPTAMTLATAGSSGRPTARVVLLKGFDERGFVFVTNFESRKAHQAESNPQAALLFFWPQLSRQVRIEGAIERCTDKESDSLFEARQRESQLGAWASPQSREISGREMLLERFEVMQGKYPAKVPRPPHWGGYRVRPQSIEFWVGREHRLHDRTVYRLTRDGGWSRHRLAP